MRKDSTAKKGRINDPTTFKDSAIIDIPAPSKTKPCDQVVFARGKILIYIVDRAAAALNPDLPQKLSDSKKPGQIYPECASRLAGKNEAEVRLV